MVGWLTWRERYEPIARAIEPSIKLTTKDCWIWKVLAALCHVFTLGGTTYREFLSRYGTTIGNRMASPREWQLLRERYIVHEATHSADMRKAGLWIHPWVGLLPYGLAYLLLPFPFGFAWCRYRLELHADMAAWRYVLMHKIETPELVRRHAKKRGEKLRGGAYGYAWLWARGGYAKAAEKVIKELSYG